MAAMDLHTAVCDLLQCEVPVVLAGMGGVARSELVAAVTDAGGFGFLGMVREPVDLIRREIDAVRRMTSLPFGVNLIPAATPADLLARQVEVCIDARIRAVALFWDLDPGLVGRLRDADIVVLCQVGSLAEAEAAQAAGADIVAVQGWEAGGHVRGTSGLGPLVAAAAARLDAPVLAAGGIVDGAGLACAMFAGAHGALVGTAFLATEESFAHDHHKSRIVDAAADQTLHTDVFHVNWPMGAHVRVLPNSVTRGEHGDAFHHPKDVIGADGDRPIYLFSTDSPLRTTTGDVEAMAIYAGQGVGQISAIVPAAERLKAIADGAAAILTRRVVQHGDGAVVEVSSPACFAAEAPDAYMGYADCNELVAEIGALLSARRAGAFLAAWWASRAPDSGRRSQARSIHTVELLARRVLVGALVSLGAELPARGRERDDADLMNPGFDDWIAQARNRDRAWSARVRKLLPRVRDHELHRALLELADTWDERIAHLLQRPSDVREPRAHPPAGAAP